MTCFSLFSNPPISIRNNLQYYTVYTVKDIPNPVSPPGHFMCSELRTVCMQSTNAFKAEGEEAVSDDAELKYAIIERRENPLAA